ncbi:DgyrCDS13152 [Dimorphilus gyrociliatus]|uniref:DgyrCDS13152 n=1 Tax=Dimorphilus gyrociliatus TaxID=2664684 RepID=A0A7I8W9X9_9ANNE|nr:DgyrCDS13152 [Dimorphilus gyrociliatus]
MKVTLKRIGLIFLICYILITCYTGYQFVQKLLKSELGNQQKILDKLTEVDEDWNPWGEEFEGADPNEDILKFDEGDEEDEVKSNGKTVEIWSKSALGIYLWEHILNASLVTRYRGIEKFGTTKINGITYRMRLGLGMFQSRKDLDATHLILVLNGSDAKKIRVSTVILNSLKLFNRLERVGVILLGNEKCENEWFEPFLKRNGGPIDVAWIVYDSELVDDKTVFQFPLGVSMHNYFKTSFKSTLDIRRPFTCNLVGTDEDDIYNLLSSKKECFVQPKIAERYESNSITRSAYIRALRTSDLTLCPAEKNLETFRIYEALSYGSIPILNIKPKEEKSKCNGSLRLLKRYNFPAIFVKDWNKDVERILHKEKFLSSQDIVIRRINAFEWYLSFKRKIMQEFLGIIENTFFSH